MGRLLVIVGVLMLVLAFALPFASGMGFMNSIGGIVNQAVKEPTAAELCSEGETLDILQGASTRSGTSSTSTGRVTSYFCVNAAGERRDVTGTVVNDLVTSVTGSSGGITSFITGSLASVGLSLGGIALIIVGAVMSTRASRKPRQVYGVQSPYSSGIGGGSPFGSQNSSPIGTPPNTPTVNVDPQNYGGQNANSVVNFVRDQLDAAYRSGQISREDYDRAIEKLNRR